TLLVDFDFDLAEKVLLHPLREPEYRHGRSHRDFMVTLRALGVQAEPCLIESVAIAAAERVFGSVTTMHDGEGIEFKPKASWASPMGQRGSLCVTVRSRCAIGND
ncbi:MAG: hypothetical protein WB781_25750, partial [Candidatus Sulfotelmatobacter sp.]